MTSSTPRWPGSPPASPRCHASGSRSRRSRSTWPRTCRASATRSTPRFTCTTWRTPTTSSPPRTTWVARTPSRWPTRTDSEHGLMDLTFTESEEEFRHEARTWLEANVPSQPLKSMDTAEGFEQHREWEKTLHGGRWSVVSWPEKYGGRDCTLIEWLIFEEEYYRSG